MKQSTASVPGKIILTGEYAVVFGKPGIAIPSEQRMNVTFTPSQKNSHSTIEWKEENIDDRWIRYAESIAEYLEERSRSGGHFSIENHLPLGKGMGSSTALVIAMTKAVLGPHAEEAAKEIEDTVNPGHSGLDFAVIWHEKPLVFKKNNAPTFIDLPKNLLAGMMLLDTGTPNETTVELVAWVKENYAKEKQPQEASCSPDAKNIQNDGSGCLPADLRDQTTIDAIDIIGNCTERLLNGEDLRTIIRDHHRAQVALGVVPKAVQKKIAEIERGGGAAKVIGAGARTGGGGMVLVIPQNKCSSFSLVPSEG